MPDLKYAGKRAVIDELLRIHLAAAENVDGPEKLPPHALLPPAEENKDTAKVNQALKLLDKADLGKLEHLHVALLDPEQHLEEKVAPEKIQRKRRPRRLLVNLCLG